MFQLITIAHANVACGGLNEPASTLILHDPPTSFKICAQIARSELILSVRLSANFIFEISRWIFMKLGTENLH
jgi:hypothetical protein